MSTIDSNRFIVTSKRHFTFSGYGSCYSFWSGGKKLSGQWKWSNGEIITTFPDRQPVNYPSYEYTILDTNAGYSLASSVDGLLNALCEGDFFCSFFSLTKQFM